GAGGMDGGVGVLRGWGGERGDLVLGGRVENVEPAAVGGFAPFAADPQIGRNIGEKVVVSRTHGCSLTTSNLSWMRAAHACIERRTRSTMRLTVGNAMSSKMSAAGSGICGVVIRTGGPSRS